MNFDIRDITKKLVVDAVKENTSCLCYTKYSNEGVSDNRSQGVSYHLRKNTRNFCQFYDVLELVYAHSLKKVMKITKDQRRSGKSRKITENHGKSRKITENHGKSQKIQKSLYHIIV